MLIDNVGVQYLTTRKVRLTWTGVEGRSAYIFVNGERKHGPLTFSGTSRTFDVAVPNPFQIEVHELRDGEEVNCAGIPLARKPSVWWSSRVGAESYTVYCRATENASETSAAVVKGDANALHFETKLKDDIRQDEPTWARLRVEARNARGQESVRDPFPLFVASLPKRPAALNVTGSGGVFDFALEL